MPNFDGGHYFLTTLIPIRPGSSDKNGASCSHVQALHRELQRLPTALQSEPAIESGIQSPFARNRRTHFARFVVVRDTIFNGREGEDPLTMKIKGADPLTPEPVDQLNCSYLMFTADFDAQSGAIEEVRGYAHELWETMRPELTAILQHCMGGFGFGSCLLEIAFEIVFVHIRAALAKKITTPHS